VHRNAGRSASSCRARDAQPLLTVRSLEDAASSPSPVILFSRNGCGDLSAEGKLCYLLFSIVRLASPVSGDLAVIGAGLRSAAYSPRLIASLSIVRSVSFASRLYLACAVVRQEVRM